MMNQPRLRIQVLTAAIVLFALSGLGCPDGFFSRGPWFDWELLRLDVQALPLLSGRVELHRRMDGGQTVLETTSTAELLGVQVAEARTRSEWSDGRGRSDTYESVSSRSGRRYRFGETGYSIEKLAPGDDAGAPLDEWQVESTQEFAYPEDADGRPVRVYDYYGMLLNLSRLELDEIGDEAVVHVATSNGVTGYRVVVADSRRTTLEVTDLADNSKSQRELTELRLRFLPTDPSRAPEGFLLMEGETEIWVESRSKTLVQISGRVPNVPGEVRLVLSEMR
jgi:hypothetical protein